LYKLFSSKGLDILIPKSFETSSTPSQQEQKHPLFAIQNNEGLWKLTEDFATKIGRNYDEVSDASPESIEELPSTVWATLLAVKYIGNDSSTATAQEWLSQQAKQADLSLDDLYQNAAQFFSKKGEQ
jgi:hypothetical protein